MEMQRQQEMQMQQQQSMQQSSSQFSQNVSSTTTSSLGMSEQQSFQSQQSFSQESSCQQVYEATEQSSHMRGYQAKGEDVTGRRSASANAARESGIFGGIGGDDNSFVENEFDYKKHTVKDLAQHFAHVKPKTQLPSNILPEQKMYNGQQVPGLNYLGGQQDFSSQKQVFTKKEVSAEDIEASKQAYEMKKKQQMEKMQQTSTTSSSSSSSTTTSQQSTVVMREKKTEETRVEQNDKRRASLSSALLMDPAAAHAQAGIIDPSAILRGSDGTNNRASIALRASEPGETELCASKWDNHNGIARGWAGVKENYHPVTFRKIYNVDTQTQNL